MSVRKITKNYRSVTGIIAARKAQGTAAFESTLERDFLFILEFDWRVLRYEVQPLRINYSGADGEPRHYTPDVLVTYLTCPPPGVELPPTTLFEVKYREDLREHWHEWRPKFKAAHRYARQQDWKFEIVTEDDIRGPYLDNIRFLQQFRGMTTEPSYRRLLKETLYDLREATPDLLLAACTTDRSVRARLIPVLWHLVGLRLIQADLSRPLTMQSALWHEETP